jgi:hypothetical protein
MKKMWNKIINFFIPKEKSFEMNVDDIYSIMLIVDEKIQNKYSWNDFDKKWTIDFIIDPSLCLSREDFLNTIYNNNIIIKEK